MGGIMPIAVKEKPGLPKTKLWVILNAEIDYIKEVMGIEHIKT